MMRAIIFIESAGYPGLQGAASRSDTV